MGTSASMCVRMKQVCASSGEHTIGSPRTLKRSVHQHRTTRMLLKFANQVVIIRIDIAADRLDARRIVHVRHRRDIRPRLVQQIEPPE